MYLRERYVSGYALKCPIDDNLDLHIFLPRQNYYRHVPLQPLKSNIDRLAKHIDQYQTR